MIARRLCKTVVIKYVYDRGSLCNSCCKIFQIYSANSTEIKVAHGISDPENRKEHFDSKTNLENKLDQLTEWIKESQYFIVFTGIFV